MYERFLKGVKGPGREVESSPVYIAEITVSLSYMPSRCAQESFLCFIYFILPYIALTFFASCLKGNVGGGGKETG